MRISERLGVNGKIALATVAIAMAWTVLGRPLAADRWLGDQPLVVQVLAMGALYLFVGWFCAPWVRGVARTARELYEAFGPHR
ncbi:MAG: hypothetical protein U0838_13260 [Chloroflexota bacterium]